MKESRFLLLGLVICLASGVKAQFYDNADEICYYVEDYCETEEIRQVYWQGMPTLNWEKTGKITKDYPKEGSEKVVIMNFDGMKAAALAGGGYDGEDIYTIKRRLQESPSYYEDKVETTEYNWKYSSSSSGVTYQQGSYSRIFSRDKSTMIQDNGSNYRWKRHYKRVDKSYFRVGRSRTPSSTMHE